MAKGKWKEIVLETLAVVLTVMFMSYAFIKGVIDYTYTYNPPTAEELADDPSLARYLK